MSFIDAFNSIRPRESWKYIAERYQELRRNPNHPIQPRHGVYLFRAPIDIPRARGISDVLYIGQSGGGRRGGRQGIGPGNGGPGRVFNTR